MEFWPPVPLLQVASQIQISCRRKSLVTTKGKKERSRHTYNTATDLMHFIQILYATGSLTPKTF